MGRKSSELRNILTPHLGAFSLLTPGILPCKTSVGLFGRPVAKTQAGGERLAPPSGPAGLEQAWGGLVQAP